MAANLVKPDLSFHAHDNPLSRGLSEESLYFSTINSCLFTLAAHLYIVSLPSPWAGSCDPQGHGINISCRWCSEHTKTTTSSLLRQARNSFTRALGLNFRAFPLAG
jgi:hypothetical protein